MTTDAEVLRIHQETNAEIVRLLNALNEHIAQLDDLVRRLREVLAKRFLLDGVADWRHGECKPEEPASG